MKRRLKYIPLIAIFVTMIIVGSFLDFQINSALYSTTDKVALFFSAFGELPGYAVLSFLGGYLLHSGIKFYKNKVGMYLLILVGIIAIGCAIYFQGNAVFAINGYDKPQYKWSTGLPLGALLTVPFSVIGFICVYRVTNKNLWKIAFILILACAIAIGLINLVKPIMHRPRFRWLITQDEVSFHNWWQPFGGSKAYIDAGVNKDQFKSFPSGHVGTASFLIFIPYLPEILQIKREKTTGVVYYVSIAYILFLAYVRMRMGAHFMSDVAWGGLISVSCHFIANEVIGKISKKVDFTF